MPADDDPHAAALAALEAEAGRLGWTGAARLTAARLLLALYRTAEAEAMLAAIAPSAPEHLDAARLLPQLALNGGRPERAAELAGGGLSAYPGDVLLTISLAQALFQQQKFAEAAPPLDAALAAESANAPLLRMRSEVAWRLGRLPAAYADALAAFELDPANAELAYHAGAMASRMGYSARASELLGIAAANQPGNAEIWLLRAQIQSSAGDIEAALRTLNEAGMHAPGHAGIQQRRLELLTRRTGATRASMLPAGPLPRSRDRPGIPGWRIQLRVLGALVSREIAQLSHFSRFGLASVVLEPLAHITVLGVVMYYFNHGRPPLGQDLFFFYATGIIPFLLFSHITEHALNSYRDNVHVMQVPLVKRVDTVIGVALVHTLVDGIACALILAALIAIGRATGLADARMVLAAFLATALLALGLGLVGAALNSASRVTQRVWYSAQRILYVLSGLFYLPMHLPAAVREWLLWNPMLHAIEWFRMGVFPHYQPPWVSPGYVLGFALALILLGLALERPFRQLARP